MHHVGTSERTAARDLCEREKIARADVAALRAHADESLTLVDNSATGTAHSCGSTPGTYSLAYTNACKTLTMTLVSDACAGRAQEVNGAVLNR